MSSENSEKEASKSYKFAIGLFYPAILGTFLYLILEEIAKGELLSSLLRVAFIIAVLFYFIFDYLYTNCEKYKYEYNLKNLFFDFFIIAGLFISANAILDIKPFNALSVYMSLIFVGIKLLALCWELMNRKKDKLAIITDVIFASLYFIHYSICGPRELSKSFLIILIIDITIYSSWDWYEKLTKINAI